MPRNGTVADVAAISDGHARRQHAHGRYGRLRAFIQDDDGLNVTIEGDEGVGETRQLVRLPLGKLVADGVDVSRGDFVVGVHCFTIC